MKREEMIENPLISALVGFIRTGLLDDQQITNMVCDVFEIGYYAGKRETMDGVVAALQSKDPGAQLLELAGEITEEIQAAAKQRLAAGEKLVEQVKSGGGKDARN